jgi:hypothetical protein
MAQPNGAIWPMTPFLRGVRLCREAQHAQEDSMPKTQASLDRTQLTIETVEHEIRILRDRYDVCEQGMALDSVSLSFYREMIYLHEELLADWRILSAQSACPLGST